MQIGVVSFEPKGEGKDNWIVAEVEVMGWTEPLEIGRVGPGIQFDSKLFELWKQVMVHTAIMLGTMVVNRMQEEDNAPKTLNS